MAVAFSKALNDVCCVFSLGSSSLDAPGLIECAMLCDASPHACIKDWLDVSCSCFVGVNVQTGCVVQLCVVIAMPRCSILYCLSG